MEETLACISIGSNQGNRESHLATAKEEISRIPGCRLDRCSKTYETRPWGVEDQSDFLNAACGLVCEISATELLQHLQSIEKACERVRTAKWGPRTLDLDIICFGEEHISSLELNIPHPFFRQRRFVLEPLAEIYPDLSIDGASVHDHFKKLLDTSDQDSQHR